MKKIYTHNGFTMLELIMVIIILGIVSSIGASVIAQTYESYIVQRAQYRANLKTELALNQIANRLRYAIPGTVGFRASTAATFYYITDSANNTGADKVLQWVGYDGDSFEAISNSAIGVATTAVSRRPGWSSFCDVDASTNTVIRTPGSNLGLAATIIANLGGNIENANILFPNGTAFGIKNTSAGENIVLDAPIPSGARIYERYKLAWSSYALSVEGGDLYLYYNFTPDVGVPLAGLKRLLLKNVTNFRFKGSEGSLRIKICKEEQIGTGTIHACKEKVVF